ncbi:S66 family peptidase [Tengunoibacter tsumagoiensis]|uniref:LD-carboxypeptidase n=1 Tax=Tengunoibacter tsumagoiensis TaxID=2014871 RepID=A0A401ZVE3_9CHLR|nr:S66 peptidase family protein [Tengunoibacter tsumagoiensis]GCE10694.1 LD-carboxypeptidase [Tengunoibacter tsumagoiensis]
MTIMPQPHSFTYPPKLRPGNKVAILSPSLGLPEVFPAVFEQGLQRLREFFQLEPVEYPTTRQLHSPPQDRARDLHAAFVDPEIKAIIASIGGDDQIKVLKYLDPELIKAHPKVFLGYSDNTNLHNFLWNLGLVSYHGGTIMVEFGRCGEMHPTTLESLKYALFERGAYQIRPASVYTDESLDWNNILSLSQHPTMFPAPGWIWHNADKHIEGTLWGGNLEILDWNLRANRYIQPVETYAGTIFYFETSEEMPSATEVYRILMCMGERGLLQQFAAVLIGRPKAWSFAHPHTAAEKATFTREWTEAVIKALSEYHPDVLAVFNLDIGHTDPQFVLPNGGQVRIDGFQKKISVIYEKIDV